MSAKSSPIAIILKNDSHRGKQYLTLRSQIINNNG